MTYIWFAAFIGAVAMWLWTDNDWARDRQRMARKAADDAATIADLRRHLARAVEETPVPYVPIGDEAERYLREGGGGS